MHSASRGKNRRKVRLCSALIFVGTALYGCQTDSSAPPAPAGAASPTPPSVVLPTATPAPRETPTAVAGGAVVIIVPTPAPVVCSPAPLTVGVGRIAIVDCAAQRYYGPLAVAVADPSIASVTAAADSHMAFFVTGMSIGTTTLSLTSQPGGSGTVTIDVTP